MMSMHQWREIKNLCEHLRVNFYYSSETQTYVFSIPEPEIDDDLSKWMDHTFLLTKKELRLTEDLIYYWGYERLSRVLNKLVRQGEKVS